MADLDDLREGADFGLGIDCEHRELRYATSGAENSPWGMNRPFCGPSRREDRQGGYACF